MKATLIKFGHFLRNITAYLFIAGLPIAGPALGDIDPSLLAGLEARQIGPATMSGRMTAIDVDLSDTNRIYVGSATGGVWLSENAGLSWEPIFDEEDFHSIGALKINQSNPDIIWVGTGEGNVRNSVSIGGGIYKSIDGGKTWMKMGLEGTERINRIALHPTNPDIAYVAALGPLWSDGEDRGVYKTTDGGETWQKILYVNESAGATDIKMDPTNPDKLYASMWQFRRWPYFFKSGGEGSGVYISYDGGESWTQKTEEDGIPGGELGRVTFAIAPSMPDRVYALVEAERSAVIRSDDGGRTWTTTNNELGINNRPMYYNEIEVDPKNPNIVYNIASTVRVSIDAGRTFEQMPAITCCAPGPYIHIDNHAWWINPDNPNHMIDGNDGGIAITHDKGETWRYVQNLPVSQFYHIAVDNDLPYNVYGGLQDNGSWRGPSETWENAGIRNFHWQEVAFGDGFDTQPDPEDSTVGYAMSQGGALYRWDIKTGELRSIFPTASSLDDPLRFNWDAGLAIDPFDPATIYYGSQYLHKSTDRGQSWETISGDLTTNNPDWQTYFESGGLTPDVTAAEFYTTIVAVSPSPVQEGVIWVGTDDGRLHVTQDGGETWTSLEDRVRGIPDVPWIPMIEPSPHDAATAFVVFEDHRRGDMGTYVYKTENFGRTWTSITDDSIRGYALSVRQDVEDPDLLFLGTELGLYFSLNGGEDWTQWTAGVPTASVMDMAIQKRENDLVLGTHGRGVIIIDDYSILRGLDEDAFDTRMGHLTITDGQHIEISQTPGARFPGNGEFFGENPDFGAWFTFIMNGNDLPHPDADQERARKIAMRTDGNDDTNAGDTHEATVRISDMDGAVVRTFKASIHQGINRIVWNLNTDGPEPQNPSEDGILPNGAEAVPGTYNVTISYDEDEISGTFDVLADPRFDATLADYQARFDATKDIEALLGKVNKARRMISDAEEALGTLKTLAEKNINAREDVADDDPVKVFLNDIEAAEEQLTNAKLEYQLPEGSFGINRSSHLVSDQLVQKTLFKIISYRGAPTPNTLASIERARERVMRSFDTVNTAIQDYVNPLAGQAENLGLTLLTPMEPVSMD